MTFLNPMILYAAFAAMVPLVLHLMARNQTVRMPFSTIRFLKLAQKQSSTKVRMENFLLWLVRTLLMLLLSLAFAKPVLRLSGTTSWSAMLGTSRRDVAIIWDASYSMGYETGRKSVWEASKETVESIIRGLSKGDRVSVFLAADTVIPIVGEATSDLDFAINTVKGQAIRTTTSNLSDTTVAALEALKDTNHEREFFIVTDGQSLAWNGFRQANAQGQAAAEPAKAGAPAKTEATAAKPPTAWNPDKIDKKSTTFFVALLGAKEPANTAPLRVEIQPPLIMTDTAPKMRVTLGHTGVAQQTSVTLFVDDREISRRAVDLEADTGGEAEFVLPELSAGNHKARIETGDDGLSIDNTYYLLIKVREDLPILIVGNAEDTFFLERALAPTDKASLKTKRTTADALAGHWTATRSFFSATPSRSPGRPSPISRSTPAAVASSRFSPATRPTRRITPRGRRCRRKCRRSSAPKKRPSARDWCCSIRSTRSLPACGCRRASRRPPPFSAGSRLANRKARARA